MAHKTQQIAVLMGPTGSGKSALALEVAKARPTVIINADAMQMVADLRVLTARPTTQEETAAEHALYGALDAAEPTSVARWIDMVTPVIEQAWGENKLPLLVGGTGMYVKALRDGLAKIPPIPPKIRERVRGMNTTELYEALKQKSAAAAFKPGDTQRLARALEVLEATGKTIGEWQSQQHEPIFSGATYRAFYVRVPRQELYDRLDQRFVKMMGAGALDEAHQLKVRDLPEGTPILKAHGVPELMAHLDERMSLTNAIARAQQNTRNYAKRQMTWLRHSSGDAKLLESGADIHGIFT